MKNNITDLNNTLFAQIERLSDEDLINDPEKLNAEIHRTKAITAVAGSIIENAGVALKAAQVADELCNTNVHIPQFLESK